MKKKSSTPNTTDLNPTALNPTARLDFDSSFLKDSKYQISCKYFNGYKPCKKNQVCSEACSFLEIPKESILIVHLGAMGAVLRSTALLPSLKRKHPSSMVTWVTEASTKALLENNPNIDRILTLSSKDQLVLSGLKFDVGYFIDKSTEVSGIQNKIHLKSSFGFTSDPLTGAVLPINNSAIELWEMGLNNHKKFFENKKTELELVAQALELPYQEDDYQIFLTSFEEDLSWRRRREWSAKGRKILIGLNTGTSGFLPRKTIPISKWIELIDKLLLFSENYQVVLLGGGESDYLIHQQLLTHFNGIQVKSVENFDAHQVSSEIDLKHTRVEGFISEEGSHTPIIASPSRLGLRDGLCSINAMDMVITGDSLGMHMAIACKKEVLVWFGPSCAHEINLFGRGAKIVTPLTCGPCWKRHCDEKITCNESIRVEEFILEINKITLKLIKDKSKDSRDMGMTAG